MKITNEPLRAYLGTPNLCFRRPWELHLSKLRIVRVSDTVFGISGNE